MKKKVKRKKNLFFFYFQNIHQTRSTRLVFGSFSPEGKHSKSMSYTTLRCWKRASLDRVFRWKTDTASPRNSRLSVSSSWFTLCEIYGSTVKSMRKRTAFNTSLKDKGKKRTKLTSVCRYLRAAMEFSALHISLNRSCFTSNRSRRRTSAVFGRCSESFQKSSSRRVGRSGSPGLPPNKKWTCRKITIERQQTRILF